MHRDCGEFFCGDEKTKNFVWGMCGDIPMQYFLHGELPTQIFLRGDLCGEDLHGSVIQGCFTDFDLNIICQISRSESFETGLHKNSKKECSFDQFFQYSVIS